MDRFITHIRNNHIIAISIGIIYLWFGLLKFFEHLSPAEDLAIRTMHSLSGGYFSSSFLLNTLAVMEVTIGLGLLFNIYQRTAIKFALFHMIFTFTPLFLFVNDAFAEPPYGLTLVGQYIMKNLVVVAALVTLNKIILNRETQKASPIQ